MKNKYIISFLFIVLIGIILTLSFYLFKEDKKSDVLTIYGNVDVRQVDISFRLNGSIDELYFEEGDQVKKGQRMCRLHPDPYDSELEQALAKANKTQIELDNAKTLFQRRRQLIYIGAVSEEEVELAETKVGALEEKLTQAEAGVKIAQDNVGYTEVHAPHDGIILTRIREPGTVVKPTDPVYTLSINNPVWVRTFIDEPYLGLVHYGMKAKILTDNGSTYEGQVGFISPIAEFTPKTVETIKLRTELVYRLRILVDNPDHKLMQGMPVTVKLMLGSSHDQD